MKNSIIYFLAIIAIMFSQPTTTNAQISLGGKKIKTKYKSKKSKKEKKQKEPSTFSLGFNYQPESKAMYIRQLALIDGSNSLESYRTYSLPSADIDFGINISNRIGILLGAGIVANRDAFINEHESGANSQGKVSPITKVQMGLDFKIARWLSIQGQGGIRFLTDEYYYKESVFENAFGSQSTVEYIANKTPFYGVSARIHLGSFFLSGGVDFLAVDTRTLLNRYDGLIDSYVIQYPETVYGINERESGDLHNPQIKIGLGFSF